MTDNEKIHQILEYICTNYDHAIVDTDEIANELNMALSGVNILARKIIQNGHAKDGGSNDSTTLAKGTVSILQTRATCDAYEEKIYLKKPVEKTSGHNINAKNVQVGNNYGNINQSSNEDKEKSKTNYALIGIILTGLSIIVAIIIGWDEFINFFK